MPFLVDENGNIFELEKPGTYVLGEDIPIPLDSRVKRKYPLKLHLNRGGCTLDFMDGDGEPSKSISIEDGGTLPFKNYDITYYAGDPSPRLILKLHHLKRA